MSCLVASLIDEPPNPLQSVWQLNDHELIRLVPVKLRHSDPSEYPLTSKGITLRKATRCPRPSVQRDKNLRCSVSECGLRETRRPGLRWSTISWSFIGDKDEQQLITRLESLVTISGCRNGSWTGGFGSSQPAKGANDPSRAVLAPSHPQGERDGGSR
ncbi:hypothetical protein LY78DRAFT_366071 [Colletotrichum sublineola]|nr:hypothetical protein LY78DRAFT_366071 [Colletotrichum sublineola]